MKKQAETQPITYEQTLINIVRTLPPERVSQLIDFARFLQSLVVKPYESEMLEEEEKSESEERWEQLLAEPEAQQAMIEMAREAREDFYAGRTTDMTITEDGRLAPA